jgi:hypothetical protein
MVFTVDVVSAVSSSAFSDLQEIKNAKNKNRADVNKSFILYALSHLIKGSQTRYVLCFAF